MHRLDYKTVGENYSPMLRRRSEVRQEATSRAVGRAAGRPASSRGAPRGVGVKLPLSQRAEEAVRTQVTSDGGVLYRSPMTGAPEQAHPVSTTAHAREAAIRPCQHLIHGEHRPLSRGSRAS